MVKKKCKDGFIEHHGKCVRRTCDLDGKNFCKVGDKPLKPPIARAGGKTQLAPKIINNAPRHKTYVEPFVGGGAVYLKKPLAQRNVINDKDKDVATVFKSLKQGKGFKKCDMTPSKERFERIKKKKNKSACDVAYLNKLSFGSGMKTFATKKYKGKGHKETGVTYQNAHAEDYKEKLKSTTILNQDFARVMETYDSSSTFHYLDPPYVGTEKVYKENKDISPERVCKVAKKMKGKVMISYNDHPEVRKHCKGLKISKTNTRYTLSSNDNNKQAKEVLITNF